MLHWSFSLSVRCSMPVPFYKTCRHTFLPMCHLTGGRQSLPVAVLGPGQGGPALPPVVVQALPLPPVFLGTNYDALSAFVVDDVLRRSCLVIWSHSTIS